MQSCELVAVYVLWNIIVTICVDAWVGFTLIIICIVFHILELYVKLIVIGVNLSKAAYISLPKTPRSMYNYCMHSYGNVADARKM